MPPRRAAVSALVLALAAAPGAVAAEKPRPLRPCALRDAAGDTAFSGVPGVPSGAADIVCGNFGIGRKQIVAVLGLRDLGDRLAEHGWQLTARVGGVELEFAAAHAVGSAPTGSVRVAGTAVRSHLALSGSTVIWRVDRRDLKPFDKSAERCLVLAAATEVAGVQADEAGATKLGKGCATAT